MIFGYAYFRESQNIIPEKYGDIHHVCYINGGRLFIKYFLSNAHDKMQILFETL